ncbi:RNA polymerase sigma factor [Brevundimonas sp.]|uniref:RNA polymerase sigma factor n=1 Tax=Brevundimonas sp. TaxID=1871086 RepID=UPI00338E0AD5
MSFSVIVDLDLGWFSVSGEAKSARTAVERLYRQYSAWLCVRLTKRYGRNNAEDLTQETWLRLEPYSRANEIRHPRALLMHIASNVAVDAARRRGRDWPAKAWEDEDWYAAEEAGQAEYVLLKQILLSLPSPLQSVFVLSRFENLTYSQIADRLGISQKTVEWRMSKALAHCASKLRD